MNENLSLEERVEKLELNQKENKENFKVINKILNNIIKSVDGVRNMAWLGL